LFAVSNIGPAEKSNHLSIHLAVHINMITSSFSSSLSQNPFNPCAPYDINENLPLIAGSSYPLRPRSTIFLCFISHPLLPFAKFSSGYLSYCIPEDSNPMQFSLLFLILYVMCVQCNPTFFILSDFLFTSDGRYSTVLRS